MRTDLQETLPENDRSARYRHCGPAEARALHELGLRESRIFPHQVYCLKKCGPDGFFLAKRMYGLTDPSKMYQVQLYADESLHHLLPTELWFDNELLWHQQQFGMRGQIATADVILAEDALYTTVRFADIVQRIGRHRRYKTTIEKQFAGWNEMLLNALASFAAEQGASRIVMPTSDLALSGTDRKRNVQPQMFERLYDRAVERQFRVQRRRDRWIIELADNRDRFLPLPSVVRKLGGTRPAICIAHDIERQLGHRGLDPAMESLPVSEFDRRLDAMAQIEQEHSVRSTYNIVGSFLPDVRGLLAEARHGVAFHSFDHRRWRRQLLRCRQVDYRIKGYRPPQSRMTWELGDKHLCLRNFEWIATSASRLRGAAAPFLQNGVVRIPIASDDFPLYKRSMSYSEWESGLLAKIAGQPFTAFGLHDCYADLWLDHYPRLLDRLAELGEMVTMDTICDRTHLSAAV